MELMKYTLSVDFIYYGGNLTDEIKEWFGDFKPFNINDEDKENSCYFMIDRTLVVPKSFIVKFGDGLVSFKERDFYRQFGKYEEDFNRSTIESGVK